MKSVTRRKPKIWGSSIVGFGSYHYKYESGREGDMLMTGFSPRSKNLVVYVMPGFERYSSLMKKLGKAQDWEIVLVFQKSNRPAGRRRHQGSEGIGFEERPAASRGQHERKSTVSRFGQVSLPGLEH